LSIDFDNGNKTIRAALEAAADKRGVTAPVAKAAPKAKAKKTTVADTVMAEAKSKAKKAVPQPMMTTAEAQVKIMEQVGEALM
jgi:hypothetical protein